MRKIEFDEWAWEQRALTILLMSLLFLNNPFFALRFVVAGWFFHFLDALMQVCFNSVLLLFWLFMVDKIRLEEMKVIFRLQHVPKLIVVAIYAILSIVFYTWVNIHDETNPTFGVVNSVTGIQVLFYLVTAIFMALIVWLMVLVVLTVPVVTSKRYLLTRFLFLASPTIVAILSILIGFLANTYGPLNRTSLELAYYSVLFNVYIWVLTVGYWPISERYNLSNPSSGESISFENILPSSELPLLKKSKK